MTFLEVALTFSSDGFLAGEGFKASHDVEKFFGDGHLALLVKLSVELYQMTRKAYPLVAVFTAGREQ